MVHDATIDASGRDGGGTVLIGGDYLGGNIDAQDAAALGVEIEEDYIPTSSFVALGDDVVVRADATKTGDGGKVIVWSDDTTVTAAEITARGGTISGDGGFIETSGKQHLSVMTAADASAPNGAVGTWLMDPVTMRVKDLSDAYVDMTFEYLTTLPVNGVPTDIYGNIYVPVDQYEWVGNPIDGYVQTPVHSSDSIIDAATIEAALNSGTSVVITNNSSWGDDAGDLYIMADIEKTSGGDALLTFNSADDIWISSGVDITSSSGMLVLYFVTHSGAVYGNNIGTLDVNGGTILLAARDGGTITSTGAMPTAIQFDLAAVPAASNNYSLSFAGGDSIDFDYTGSTVSFGANAINISNTQTGLSFVLDHDVKIADRSINISNQSSLAWLLDDPASTFGVDAGSDGNNIAEIASNGVIVVGSKNGVGGALNVIPTIEVNSNLVPATQCAGITCVPIDEIEQAVLDPLDIQKTIDLLADEDAGSCSLGDAQCLFPEDELEDSVRSKGVPRGKIFDRTIRVSAGFLDDAYKVQFDRQHLGTDIPGAVDEKILSPVNGRVSWINLDSDDPFNSMIVVQELDQTGTPTGLYLVFGHIGALDDELGQQISKLPVDTDLIQEGVELEIGLGDPIGSILPANGVSTGSHLHLGARSKPITRLLEKYPDGKAGWGRAPKETTEQEIRNRGWLDPKDYFDR